MEENAVKIQWKKMLLRFNERKCCEGSMEENAVKIQRKKCCEISMGENAGKIQWTKIL